MNKLIFKILNGSLYYSDDNGCTYKNIGIVKGDKGDQGDTGEQGPQGENGIDGINGTNGTNGTNGQNGLPLTMKETEEECTHVNDAYIVSSGVNRGDLMVRKATSGTNQWTNCGNLMGLKGDDGNTPEITATYHAAESLSDRPYYKVFSDGVLVATIYEGDHCTINDTDDHWYINGFDTGIVAKAGDTVYDGTLTILAAGEAVSSFSANSQQNKNLYVNEGDGIVLNPGNNQFSIAMRNPHYSCIYDYDYFTTDDSLILKDKKSNTFKSPSDFTYRLNYSACVKDDKAFIHLRYYVNLLQAGNIEWSYFITGTITQANFTAISTQQNIVGTRAIRIYSDDSEYFNVDPIHMITQCNQINKVIGNDSCKISGYISIDLDFAISLVNFNKYFDKGFMYNTSQVILQY